ncbi:MAG: hypothetical protein V3R16_02350 [Nitrospirales bacterium]
MRRAARKDLAQHPIVDELRICGVTVFILNQERLPDLLCGFRNRMWLLEVKHPPGPRGGQPGQSTPDQEEFSRTWRGPPVHIVHSIQEAKAVLGIR